MMIKFLLRCYNGHEFDSWFLDSDSYAKQQDMKLVACPHCGICEVSKAITAPNLVRVKSKSEANTHPEIQAKELLRNITTYVKSNFDDVGDNFAQEARRIHNGESDARGIYGHTTPEEARDLNDDGIEVHVLPEFKADA